MNNHLAKPLSKSHLSSSKSSFHFGLVFFFFFLRKKLWGEVRWASVFDFRVCVCVLEVKIDTFICCIFLFCGLKALCLLLILSSHMNINIYARSIERIHTRKLNHSNPTNSSLSLWFIYWAYQWTTMTTILFYLVSHLFFIFSR